MPFTFSKVQKSVAFFILLGLIMLTIFILLIAQGYDLFKFKDVYYTKLNDSYGLMSGMPLEYKGFNIGKIKNIELIEGREIQLDLFVFSDYQYLIRENTVVKVATSILGTSSLILYTDLSNTMPVLDPYSLIFSSDMKQGKELLKLYQTQGNNEDLMVKVNDIANEILPTIQHIRTITEDLKNVTHDIQSTNNSIGAMIRDEGDLYSKIREMTLKIDQTINIINNSLVTVSNSVNTVDSSFSKISNTLDNIDNIAESTADLGNKLDQFPEEIQSLIVLLKENLEELKKTLKSVQTIVGSENNESIIINGGGSRQ